MLHIEWTSLALRDIRDAGEFIAMNNRNAADLVAKRIIDAVEYLREYPMIGRSGRVLGTRELVISGTPFIVVYRKNVSAIQILRILHHARKWP
ncbi:type II toxin-antitoxin system RelE/ParE family toxin [Candidatus Magnetomonas plexicatena]|uniref:type II toxin-antitoxin system RelE/ParE family toxin n=1 Tax=Candidatus Magnetomonas plexicatena TaxID=2552947 RepID=UPI001C7481D5|nr:type II toxin-antitoxin system RelE/ParE family toxin [Nitrospirales bacterium LBB_01]